MAEKKREALAAVELMRATFARVRSDEESKRGVVIIKALYGRLTNIADVSRRETEDEEGREAGTTADPEYVDEVIDVTIPLQCLVKDSKLVLHESSKVCRSFETLHLTLQKTWLVENKVLVVLGLVFLLYFNI
jgi:DnaJ family protein C protein 11